MKWTLELVVVPVSDIDRAKAFYTEKAGFGLDVDHSPGEVFHFGAAGQTPGPDLQRADYNSFLPFQDPDGNHCLVQEVRSRA